MNKKYLQENNLMEMHKQFMRLSEYVSAIPLTEEGDEEETDSQSQGPNATANPNDTSGMPPIPDPNGMGDDQNGMGGEPNDMQDSNGMGGGPNDMGDSNGMGGEPNDMGGMPPIPGPMESGEEDEVIDVDDITNAQEKTNDKVNKVGRNLGKVDDKIVQLLQAIDKMETMINNNNAEIENFKREFEKRNPTPTEKLNLRSLDSYPFNVNPKEYWEDKGIANPGTSNQYQTYSDNHESTIDEYEITNSDIDNFDERRIADSFHIDDDLRQTIEKIFDL